MVTMLRDVVESMKLSKMDTMLRDVVELMKLSMMDTMLRDVVELMKLSMMDTMTDEFGQLDLSRYYQINIKGVLFLEFHLPIIFK